MLGYRKWHQGRLHVNCSLSCLYRCFTLSWGADRCRGLRRVSHSDASTSLKQVIQHSPREHVIGKPDAIFGLDLLSSGSSELYVLGSPRWRISQLVHFTHPPPRWSYLEDSRSSPPAIWCTSTTRTKKSDNDKKKRMRSMRGGGLSAMREGENEETAGEKKRRDQSRHRHRDPDLHPRNTHTLHHNLFKRIQSRDRSLPNTGFRLEPLHQCSMPRSLL